MQRADLSAFSIFAAVAERRNFRAAAQGLGLSPSAVSHAVGALEAKLGVRLLARTTRSVAPTEAGQRLLARLRPALVEIESAIAELDASRNVPAGVLRLTVPRSAAKHLILPRAAAFARVPTPTSSSTSTATKASSTSSLAASMQGFASARVSSGT